MSYKFLLITRVQHPEKNVQSSEEKTGTLEQARKHLENIFTAYAKTVFKTVLITYDNHDVMLISDIDEFEEYVKNMNIDIDDEKEKEDYKLIPFDLKKAKAGAIVCTCNGKDVRLFCFDFLGDYTISGSIKTFVCAEEIELHGSWTEEGLCNLNEKTDEFNLCMKVFRKTGYAIIIKEEKITSLSRDIYETEVEAYVDSIPYQKATVIEIEWYE